MTRGGGSCGDRGCLGGGRTCRRTVGGWQSAVTRPRRTVTRRATPLCGGGGVSPVSPESPGVTVGPSSSSSSSSESGGGRGGGTHNDGDKAQWGPRRPGPTAPPKTGGDTQASGFGEGGLTHLSFGVQRSIPTPGGTQTSRFWGGGVPTWVLGCGGSPHPGGGHPGVWAPQHPPKTGGTQASGFRSGVSPRVLG